MMQHFPEYIKEHEKQSFQEIKANLNMKIQEMITKTKVRHLQAEKQQISQEKESRLQRFLHGTTLKEQKIANIDAKIELEKRQSATRNPENSIKVMMANLYDCSVQDLQGQFSPEMQETIYAIRKNFGNLPSEELLTQQAYQKANANYPAVIGEKKLSKKKQINYYQQDTDRIKVEIYNCMHNSRPVQQGVQIHALDQFEGTVMNIREFFERDYGETYNINRDIQPTIWNVK